MYIIIHYWSALTQNVRVHYWGLDCRGQSTNNDLLINNEDGTSMLNMTNLKQIVDNDGLP